MNVWQLGRFLYLLMVRFERNENRKTAAQLTFVTLFAIVPLMTSSYVFSTLLPWSSGFAELFQNFIFLHFVPASGEAVKGYLSGFSEQARQLTWIGLAILLLSAMSLMLTIESAFNRIWRVRSQRVGRRIVMYWVFIVLAPVFLALVFFISSYLMGSGLWLRYVDAAFGVNDQIVRVLPLLLSSVGLALMYYFLPSCKVRFWHGLFGALVAAGILEVSKQVFVFLVSLMPAYQIVYGAFAAVPLFLLWLYVAWSVVLLGAELVRALPFLQKNLKGTNASQLDWALLILQFMSIKNLKLGVPREELVAALSLPNADEWEIVLNVLLASNWVESVDDQFYLRANLACVTVGELSELIHGETLKKFAVVTKNSSWFDVLKPMLLDLREHKKLALGLPIASVISNV